MRDLPHKAFELQRSIAQLNEYIFNERKFKVEPNEKPAQMEAEVLKLIALGFTNKEIARRLDIGIKSIETYKSRGVEKLGLKTRADIVRYASTRGWLAD